MSYMFNRSRKYSYLIFFLLTLLFVPFQNCSKTHFTASESSVRLFATQDIILENNKLATNKKILNIKIIGAQIGKALMRVYEINNFNESIDWVPVTEKTVVDLKDQYATSGLKDDFKTVIVEFKSILTGTIERVEKKILLDTLSPQIRTLGILATGMVGSGKSYNLGEVAELNWDAEDLLAVTGNKSDLDPSEAIQVGWSKLADCSINNIVSISQAMPNANKYTEFKWPTNDALDAFYVCVFVKDVAGNQSVGLSQPLSYQWSVLIGDNNLGSGGSVTSSSVRFNSPNDIEADSKGNLFVSDDRYGQLRMISSDGIITSVLGNRSPGATPDSVQNYSGRSMSFDSKDRLYILAGGEIQRIEYNANEKIFNKTKLFYTAGLTAFSIKKAKNANEDDQVYIGINKGWITDTTEKLESLSIAQNYIFKISLKDIESNFAQNKTTYLTSDLLEKYHFAGNGSTYLSSELKEFDQEAKEDRMGYIYSLFADPNTDDLFMSTIGDGVGRPYGDHAIRLLRKNNLGVVMNYRLTYAAWVLDINVAQFINKKYLIFAGHGTAGYINLTEKLSEAFFKEKKSLTYNAEMVIPALTTLVGIGGDGVFNGIAVIDSRNNQLLAEPEIYLNYSSGARIAKLDSNLKVIETYGRAPYADKDSDSLQSALNNPTAVTQDKNGQIYVMETPSCIIRKMDTSGQLSIFAGNPCSVANSIAPTEIDKKETTDFIDLKAFFSGYYGTLAYDNKSDKLYAGLSASGKISEINLVTKKVKTQVYLDRNQTSAHPIYNMSMIQSPNAESSLYVTRLRTVAQNGINPGSAAIEKINLSSLSTPTTILGNLFIESQSTLIKTGDSLSAVKMNYGVNATTSDVNGDVYYSNYSAGKSQIVRLVNNQQIVVAEVFGNINSMVIHRIGQSLHFFYILALGELHHLEMNLGDFTLLNKMAPTKLCLKGTYLSGAYNINFSNDKNLMISDTYNNRIVKYYLFDKEGQLVLNTGCK